MSETSQEASAAAFTVRTNRKFKLPTRTERKLHYDCCSRKLKEKTEGKEKRVEHITFKGGYKYAFRNGIHDSPGRSAGEPRRGLPGASRSRRQHYRFSVEPRHAGKEFGSYGD